MKQIYRMGSAAPVRIHRIVVEPGRAPDRAAKPAAVVECEPNAKFFNATAWGELSIALWYEAPDPNQYDNPLSDRHVTVWCRREGEAAPVTRDVQFLASIPVRGSIYHVFAKVW